MMDVCMCAQSLSCVWLSVDICHYIWGYFWIHVLVFVDICGYMSLYLSKPLECTPWRRKLQPTPVSLPGKFHGRRSLAGYSSRGRKVGHDWVTSLRMYNSKRGHWGSPVTQWLRIHLPVQESQVRSLIWEDPTCRRATEPVHDNYWASALEPRNHAATAEIRVPHSLCSATRETTPMRSPAHCKKG